MDFETYGYLGLTPVTVESATTAHSRDKQGVDFWVMFKRQIKTSVVAMVVSTLLEIRIENT